MAISQPGYPITTAGLVTHVGGYTDSVAGGAPTVINATSSPYNMATGNTGAANRTALQAALDAAAAVRGTVYIPAGVYTLPIIDPYICTVPDGVKGVWMADGAVLDISAGGSGGVTTIFYVKGSEAARDATGWQFLTTVANPGDTVLNVSSSAAFAMHDYVRIGSTTFWDPGSRDGRIGEIHRVDSVAAGTITLREPLVGGPYFPGGRVTTTATTLRGAMDATQATVPVADASSYLMPYVNHPGRIQVDSEVMTYTYRDDLNFYGVTRGTAGTSAATHLTAATVTELPWVTTLNGTITAGATTITLTSVTGFGAPLEPGVYVQIDSEKIYGTLSGSTLINCVRGVGGTTAAGHTTGATVTEIQAAHIAKVTMKEDVTFRGGEFRGPELPESDNSYYRAIEGWRTSRLRVLNCRFINMKERCVDLLDSVNFLIQGNYFEGTDRNNLGYPIAVGYVSQDGLICDNIARRPRHFVTCGAQGGQGTSGSIGIPRRVRVANNIGYDSYGGSMFDNHSGGEGFVFDGNVIYDPGDSGFWINSPNAEIINNVVVRPGNAGCWIFNMTPQPTEYKITGNRIVRPGAAGGIVVYVESAAGRPTSAQITRSIQILANNIIDPQNAAIQVDGSSSAGAGQLIRVAGLVVANNVVNRVRRNFPQHSIACSYLEGAVFQGNICSEGYYHDISLVQCTKCAVTGNTSITRVGDVQSGYAGVSCATCDQCSITGNVILGKSVGVLLDNASSYCVVMANNVRGCATPLSLGSGTGHVSTTASASGAYNVL